MNAIVMTARIAEASPQFKARIAGVFYLLTFVTGVFAFVSGKLVANVIATACYVAVTLLFYAHLWLLVFGVNEQRWKKQAAGAGACRSDSAIRA